MTTGEADWYRRFPGYMIQSFPGAKRVQKERRWTGACLKRPEKRDET
jgi:hypothetical protein